MAYNKYKVDHERLTAIENVNEHPLVKGKYLLDEIEQSIIHALPKYEEIVNKIKKQNFPASVEVMPEIIQVSIY